MKDSGIEWIGEIPEDWKLVFCKYNFKILSGSTPESSKQNYWDGDIYWITPADYKTDDKYVSKGKRNITLDGYNSCSTNLIPKGSIIFSKRAPIGTVAIAKNDLCTNQGCLACIPKTENYSTDYYYYFFAIGTEHYNLLGSGTTFKEISATAFENSKIPLPPIETQKQIAIFLDVKCAKIDSLKSDIEKQIETLEQYKKSVITEAVTRGINPDLKMKDSGIEWIGEIPEHWQIHPIYYYFEERKHKNSLCKEQNLLSLSYGNVIRKDINALGGLLPESFNTYNIIEKDDIVIRPTDLQNDKRSLRTGLCKEHGIITSAYITLKPKKDVNSQYYHYLLHSYDIEKVFYNMGNGVRQGLNYSEFKKLLVISPTFDEQKNIVEYLDSKCLSIDNIINSKKQQLEKLEEYKKSLLFEYVTGKKEI